ncbi:MAG: RCC1 domain-containing protein, partial [Planctomycetota bacterium]|nr:RCC1 domain-containing protein [Planctomycetota bacterium]
QTKDYNKGDATEVTAGFTHNCILMSNGNIHCWGDLGHDQVSDWPSKTTTIPSAIVDGDSEIGELSGGNVTYGMGILLIVLIFLAIGGYFLMKGKGKGAEKP